MVELTRAECIFALGTHDVGRVCLIDKGYPVAYPVNYRVVVDVGKTGDATAKDQLAIVFRAREGGVLDHPTDRVGFQVDGVDPIAQTGWSVLVRGTLHSGQSDTVPPWLHSWDPHPWADEREKWLYVVVETISGRQLLRSEQEWAFEIRGYL